MKWEKREKEKKDKRSAHPGDVSRSSTPTEEPTDQHRERPTQRNPLRICGWWLVPVGGISHAWDLA